MTEFNPLAGSILQSTQVQRQAESDKQRQVRRAQALAKDSAARTDRFEHEVESAEAVAPANDEDQRGGHPNQPEHPPGEPDDQPKSGEERPRLDLTA